MRQREASEIESAYRREYTPRLSHSGSALHAEAVVNHAHADERHEDLVVSRAPTGIHGVNAIEQLHDLLLIEVGDGGHGAAAQQILYVDVEGLVGIECCRRAQEWVLLALIHGIGDNV